uniref:Uncharacterized protein n=1 Tax=Arundo donax TaxID=35708 RepID=A0A0A9GJB4_ARUDO
MYCCHYLGAFCDWWVLVDCNICLKNCMLLITSYVTYFSEWMHAN